MIRYDDIQADAEAAQDDLNEFLYRTRAGGPPATGPFAEANPWGKRWGWSFENDETLRGYLTPLEDEADRTAANAYWAWARGQEAGAIHNGQHELELCGECRVAVWGPEYWDFD